MSTFVAPRNPYQQYEGSRNWELLDRAVQELTLNHDLVEATPHNLIVGYLCQALASPAEDCPTPEQRRKALKNLREMVRDSELRGRDLVGELIAERRAEALRE